MISLSITDKDGSSTTTTFDKQEVLIGRVKGNDVVLPKTNVSKRHSRIVVKEGRAILVDMKSTNGTFVNGQKISAPRQLVEGDKVFIGDFTIEVREITTTPAAPSGSPIPSFNNAPSVGSVPPMGGHAEGVRPLAGAPSLGGLPSLGNLPPVSGLPTLGNLPPVGGAPASNVPSLGNLPPVGGAPSLSPSPLGPSASPLGGGAPAPMGPGASSPIGAPVGIGASPAAPSLNPSPLGGSGSAPMGPGSAPMGPGSAPMGPGSAPMGPGSAPMGPGSAPMGPGSSNPMGPAVGLGASSASSSSPDSGLGASSHLGASPSSSPLGVGRLPGAGLGTDKAASESNEKSLRGTLERSIPSGASVSTGARRAEKQAASAKAVSVASVSASLPEEIIVDDARNPESDALINAARIVMDAYLGQVDFQTLVSQAYPPEPDVQDACYSELLAIANANRPSLGNVNIDQLLEFLLREVCGLGAIDSLIDDEAVTDFVVYNSEMIVADRQGRREITSLQFTSPDTLYLAAQRILSFQGLTDQTAPAVSEVRLGDGTQIEVVISPVSVSSTYVVVRKTCRKFNALPALVQCDVLSNEMAKFLLLCVKARRNILVVGAQGSGRTSILNALGSEISDGERIVTIENSAMMMMPQLYVLSLEAQNSSVCQAGDLASLIRQASRLRAERVLVDTLQSPADASAFLGAIYAGAQGSMATISGLTANEGFNNLERMSCADNVNAGFAKIAGIIDIVVTTRAFSDASRRIVEISEVARTEDGGFVLVPIFEWNDSVMDKGQFRATGNIPEFYQALERGGVSLDPSIFNV